MNNEKTSSGLPTVNVDIGARAEAKFELKAEIPSSSMGRLVDAITDIIRPISESRGLRADLIRLQREDVAFEIVRRARNRLEQGRLPLHSIPLKFLVPFLEASSTEESDGELIDWWASLLASAATNREYQHPLFVKMMSQVTAADAKFLEEIWTVSGAPPKKLSWAFIGHVLARKIEEGCVKNNLLNNEPEFSREITNVACEAISSMCRSGVFCNYIRLPGNSTPIALNSDPQAFEIATAIGILERGTAVFPVPTPYIGEFVASGEFFTFSDLGLRFVRACHLDTRETS